MADAGSGHRTADFLLTTGGLKGLLHNGCAACDHCRGRVAAGPAAYIRPSAFAAAHRCMFRQTPNFVCAPEYAMRQLSLQASKHASLRCAAAQRATLLTCDRRPFVAAFIAFAIAQITKLFTFYYTENRWDFTRIVGSGGMPSSHTSMVRTAAVHRGRRRCREVVSMTRTRRMPRPRCVSRRMCVLCENMLQRTEFGGSEAHHWSMSCRLWTLQCKASVAFAQQLLISIRLGCPGP